MRGREPLQTGLHRGIENQGFNQIKNDILYFSEKKFLVLVHFK